VPIFARIANREGARVSIKTWLLGFIGRILHASWKRAAARYDWWGDVWNAHIQAETEKRKKAKA